MARKARVRSTTGIYHVVMQGANMQEIFCEQEDYLQFVGTLSKLSHSVCEEGVARNFRLYAYVLLPTHVHLLIAEDGETIGMVIKRICSSYSYYFNHKYVRNGSLYKERFQSTPVNDDDTFTNILCCIHHTPVKMGLASSPDVYPYSSWHEYVGTPSRLLPPLCEIRDQYRQMSPADLRQLLNTPLTESICYVEPKTTVAHRLSDGQVWLAIVRMTGVKTKSDFQSLTTDVRLNTLARMRRQGASIRQLEHLTGTGRGIIQRL